MVHLRFQHHIREMVYFMADNATWTYGTDSVHGGITGTTSASASNSARALRFPFVVRYSRTFLHIYTHTTGGGTDSVVGVNNISRTKFISMTLPDGFTGNIINNDDTILMDIDERALWEVTTLGSGTVSFGTRTRGVFMTY